MKRFKIMVILVVLFFTFNAFAEEKSAEDQVMMKKWMEYASPGKLHKGLEYFAGKWDAVTKYWMKPGDKPMETTGTAFAKMIMGGRYLKTYTKGKMMGMEFTGLSILGYDNFNKKFVGTWLDSNGTGLFPYEGTLDSSGMTRTDSATWPDIMTGGTHDVRMVTTIVDKNTYKFDMYMKYPKTPEFKSMEMIYSRILCCEKKKSSKEKNCCNKHKGNKTKKCNKKK
ncbi:MAG: DUF1579 domain-containing protein [Acidobacteriota bacterium]